MVRHKDVNRNNNMTMLPPRLYVHSGAPTIRPSRKTETVEDDKEHESHQRQTENTPEYRERHRHSYVVARGHSKIVRASRELSGDHPRISRGPQHHRDVDIFIRNAICTQSLRLVLGGVVVSRVIYCHPTLALRLECVRARVKDQLVPVVLHEVNGVQPLSVRGHVLIPVTLLSAGARVTSVNMSFVLAFICLQRGERRRFIR